MIDITMKRNPTGRMTTPEDVANAILALPAKAPSSSTATSSASTAASSSPAQARRERPGHRRRLGQRRPRRRPSSACRTRRDRDRWPPRQPSRRQGREPGGGGGPPRGPTLVHRRDRRATPSVADARATLEAEGVDSAARPSPATRPESRSSWSTRPARTRSPWPGRQRDADLGARCARRSSGWPLRGRRRAGRARDPDRGHARGAASGQDRRGDYDPQSGPGHRPRPLDARPRRHPDPERGRAGGPRRTRGLAVRRRTEAARPRAREPRRAGQPRSARGDARRGPAAHAIHAPRVDAVDTVGAGDALNGALAAGLAEGSTCPRPPGEPSWPRRSRSPELARVPGCPPRASSRRRSPEGRASRPTWSGRWRRA